MEEILADSEDEEEELEEQKRGKEGRKQARQKGQAWLKEGEEDEPLNFLDPNVSQRVLGEDQSLGCGWGGVDGGDCCGAQRQWGYDCPWQWVLPQALTHLSVSSHQTRPQAGQRSEPRLPGV